MPSHLMRRQAGQNTTFILTETPPAKPYVAQMRWLKMCWKGVSYTEASNTIAANANGGIAIAF